jgi:hypothetical protein
VHDTTWFELNGKPAVFIASEEFQEAATAQAQALGLPNVHRVFVAHPIQDANDVEMAKKANDVIDEVIAALVD